MLKNDDFKLLRGFVTNLLMDRQTNEWTDICESRVAFVTENTENWYGNLRILTNSESIGNISYIHFQSLALLIL